MGLLAFRNPQEFISIATKKTYLSTALLSGKSLLYSDYDKHMLAWETLSLKNTPIVCFIVDACIVIRDIIEYPDSTRGEEPLEILWLYYWLYIQL